MGQTAIVIGSGIGGPLVALALHNAGVSATVYEAYPESAGLTTGLWLTMAVNGISALRTLGADAAVMRAGFASETIEFASGTGKPLGSLPIGGRLDDGSLTHTLKRADLLAALQRVAA